MMDLEETVLLVAIGEAFSPVDCRDERAGDCILTSFDKVEIRVSSPVLAIPRWGQRLPHLGDGMRSVLLISCLEMTGAAGWDRIWRYPDY